MTVNLQRSNGLLLYLVLIHALAVLLLCLLKLEVILSVLLGLLLLLSLFISCRRYGWLHGLADITQLRCEDDERWFLDAELRQTRAWQLQHSVQLGPLMVLRFRSRAEKHTQSVVVVRDAVDVDTWRQLCLKLRDPETWD
jgi:hypothetical protein